MRRRVQQGTLSSICQHSQCVETQVVIHDTATDTAQIETTLVDRPPMGGFHTKPHHKRQALQTEKNMRLEHDIWLI